MIAERTGSVFWLLVGVTALHGGIDLGLGSTAAPQHPARAFWLS